MKDSAHDKLFKEAFGNPRNAAAEIRCLAPPALVAQMDFASLTAVPGSFRDVTLADSSSDLLFSLRIAGRGSLVYVLFEHKSSTDRSVAFQLLRYMVRIWERCRHENPKLERLPAIVPLVVHYNDTGWTAGNRFDSVVDPFVKETPELARLTPRFEFLLDDIGRATDEQIRGRALNAFGVLTWLFLRDARRSDRFLAAFVHWADLVRDVLDAPDGPRALMVLFRYVSIVLDELEWSKFHSVAHTVLPETEETFMSMSDKWLEEGRQQGLEQGQRWLLIELLQTKFGSVDEQVVRRLDAADASALKRYAQRILTATTLDEVFTGQS